MRKHQQNDIDTISAGPQTYKHVTPEDRRRMQSVRHRDTEPELRVRRVLHAMGYRFRLHRKDLPGTPDIVLPRYRKIVLVHGCFWHGHDGCKRATRPINNADAWAAKIKGNIWRDKQNLDALRAGGWGVLVVWECEVRDAARLEKQLRSFLESD